MTTAIAIALARVFASTGPKANPRETNRAIQVASRRKPHAANYTLQPKPFWGKRICSHSIPCDCHCAAQVFEPQMRATFVVVGAAGDQRFLRVQFFTCLRAGDVLRCLLLKG
eukprot:4804136-Pyramimonas_sp.AAC.1